MIKINIVFIQLMSPYWLPILIKFTIIVTQHNKIKVGKSNGENEFKITFTALQGYRDSQVERRCIYKYLCQLLESAMSLCGDFSHTGLRG